MLYVTTRNDREVYTPSHTFRNSRGKDGGFYVPFHISAFPQPDSGINDRRLFSERTKDMIRFLFHSGKNDGPFLGPECFRCLQLVPAGQKIVAAKLPEEGLLRLRSAIYHACEITQPQNSLSDWASVAVWISLYAIIGKLQLEGILGEGQKLEISLSCHQFPAIMGALYARSMALPVGRIICGCDEEIPLWELLRHGQLKARDSFLPDGIERLIHWAGGSGEVSRFLDACERHGIYQAPEAVGGMFRQALYGTVASRSRILDILTNFREMGLRNLSANGALSFAAVQDYRSLSGTRELALIVSD